MRCVVSEIIKAINVEKAYYQGKTKIVAVKNANLTISNKETVLITGPSGAGKSTLLNLLGGLDRPTGGTVLFGGSDFRNMHDSALSRVRNEKIGFVFQFYHLLPEFSVLENVMLPGVMKRGRKSGPDIKRAAQDILRLVSMEKRMHHRPSEISGGESQRAAIARSLINYPDILLCDEPTGNLDSKVGQEVMDCLWELKKKRCMALVIVTHDGHIHREFDRRYRIEDGVIKELGHGNENIPERQVCR